MHQGLTKAFEIKIVFDQIPLVSTSSICQVRDFIFNINQIMKFSDSH